MALTPGTMLLQNSAADRSSATAIQTHHVPLYLCVGYATPLSWIVSSVNGVFSVDEAADISDHWFVIGRVADGANPFAPTIARGVRVIDQAPINMPGSAGSYVVRDIFNALGQPSAANRFWVLVDRYGGGRELLNASLVTPPPAP